MSLKNMLNSAHKKIYLPIIILIIISFAFCCNMAFFEVFAANSMPGMQSHTACGEFMGSAEMGHRQMTPSSTSSFLLLLFLLIATLFFALKKMGGKNGREYAKLIRTRYGGFSYFNYFIDFLSSGILNPKIF